MSRKLARKTFHAMVRFGPRLEQRQMVLFRLVDIGAELFAMAATCSRAEMLRKKGQPEAAELADLFCTDASRRVKAAFGASSTTTTCRPMTSRRTCSPASTPGWRRDSPKAVRRSVGRAVSHGGVQWIPRFFC